MKDKDLLQLAEARGLGNNGSPLVCGMKTDARFEVKTGLSLNIEDVHLWRADIPGMTACVPRWMPMLSADEQMRAGRFHHAVDRNRFVVVRAMLRQILGSYLGKDPQKLSFRYLEKEKPALGEEEMASDIAFNVSHSGEIALLAFGRNREIGVDVEQFRPSTDTQAIAKRFFSPNEQRQLAALAQQEREEGFFRCWTRKESFIKATGKGLSLPLRDFDVSLEPGDHDALLATRPNPLERTRWRLCDLPVETGYAAALCVSGTDWRLVEKSERECGA